MLFETFALSLRKRVFNDRWVLGSVGDLKGGLMIG